MTKVAVMDDAELLQVYAEQDSNAAFEELVRRYIGLVHSSALRQTHRPQLAEDVTQAVFIVLAKKARRLGKVSSLAGWLFRTTRLAGAQAVRNELRRERREQLAMTMVGLETAGETDAAWEQAAPLLDDALAKLSARDREAVLLRFYQNKPLKEVGLCLDCTEEAARKIVARALEKLRGSLSRRGVVLSALTLGSAISTHSVEAAPTPLTSSVCLIGVSKGADASSSVLELAGGIMKAMFIGKAKLAAGIVAGTIVLAMVPRAWPQQPGSFDPSFQFGLPDAGVRSVAFQPDGRILFAGGFANSSVVVGGQRFYYSAFARLNYDGSVDTSFGSAATGYSFKPIDEADGYTVALQKDGKIVIGGAWSKTNALKHANIARLNSDGTLDPTFNVGLGTDWTPGQSRNSYVSQLVVQDDDKILLSGLFKQIAGVNRDGFARLNADGSLDQSFNPPATAIFNGGLQRPILPDGRIIVQTQSLGAVYRLNSDGSIDPSFTPITRPVDGAAPLFNPLGVGRDGSLVGTLTTLATYSGTSWTLARYNSDGTRDTNFTATFTKADKIATGYVITDAAVDQNGKVVVVGRFDHVNGTPRFDIARLNPDGSLDTAFDAGPRITNQIHAQWVFLEPDGQILVSGQSATNGVPSTYLLRLMGNSSMQFISFRRTLGGLVQGNLESQDARSIEIETSSNLKDWLPVTRLTNGPAASILNFSIQTTPGAGSAFYRAVLQ